MATGYQRITVKGFFAVHQGPAADVAECTDDRWVGETFCALSATTPSCRHKHLVMDPPIADSSGPEASINIFPAASSLIDKRVGLLSC